MNANAPVRHARTIYRSLSTLLMMTVVTSVIGCFSDATGAEEAEMEVAADTEAVILGTEDRTFGHGVMIGPLGLGCSGTMLTNTWAISANHCWGDPSSQDTDVNWLNTQIVQYGGTRYRAGVAGTGPAQQAVVKRLIRHPTNKAGQIQGVDVILFELKTPLNLDGSTTGFVRQLIVGPSCVRQDGVAVASRVIVI